MSGERPFSMVLQDIVRNIQDIVRSEVRLAKTEVREELAKTRTAGVLVVLGALAALFAAGFLLLAGFFVLRRSLPAWEAALCLAVIVGIVAAITIAAGTLRFKTLNAAAPKAVASLKENVEWAKQQIK